MDIEIAKAIVGQDPENLSLHENYSGRGMYGRQTAGVSTNGLYVGESDIYYKAVMEAMEEAIEDAIHNVKTSSEQGVALFGDVDVWEAVDAAKGAARKVMEAAVNCSTDSMGLGTIWY